METYDGRSGHYFEDLKPGNTYRHALGRTMIDADTVWFTNLVLSPKQQYFNLDYARKNGSHRIEVNPAFVMGMVTGMSVGDMSQNGINLEWKEVTMPNPLYVGETLYAESTVLSARESKSKREQGIVTFQTRGVTESGKIVLELVRSILAYKREYAPQKQLFPNTPEWSI